MNRKDFQGEKIEKVKKNGFPLLGMITSGKSALLNSIFNKEMIKDLRSAKALTKIPNLFYYKLYNGKYIILMDSPGLSDPQKLECPNEDNIHLDEIIKLKRVLV